MNKYLMECVGTFFLTLAIVLTGNPISIGLMLAVMIYIGGHISGAHYNPAVSIMMMMKNRLSVNDFIFYSISQTIGALAAGGIYIMIVKSVFVPDVIPGIPFVLTAGLELMLTMVLCWTILTVVNNVKYANSGTDGMIIGFSLMSLAFVGGLFNPAIALSSAICSVVMGNGFVTPQNLIIFLAMPLIAGVITPFVDKCCKGKM